MLSSLALGLAATVTAGWLGVGELSREILVPGIEAYQSLPREYVKPIPSPALGVGKSVALEKIIQGVRIDKTVGHFGYGLGCTPGQTVTLEAFGQWFGEDRYGDIFKSEFQRAGYRLVDHDQELFAENEKEADFLIGGSIKDIFLTACMDYYPQQDLHLVTAIAARATTEWKIFDPVIKSVTRTLTTNGEFFWNPNADLSPAIVQQSMQMAFRDTVSTMMADRTFYRMLFGDIVSEYEKGLEPFGLTGVGFDDTSRFNKSKNRKGIVVVSTGQMVGEGVILNKEGYILTSVDVLTGEQDINVFLHNGSSFTGRVIQAAPFQDVALIQITPGTAELFPVPLRKKPIISDEDVIVIGDGRKNRKTQHPRLTSLKSGKVTSITSSETGHKILIVDVPLREASYGKPLFDIHGNLMGIAIRDFAREISRKNAIRFMSIDSALDAMLVHTVHNDAISATASE